jgi:uncharacterized protein (DUF1800 family)
MRSRAVLASASAVFLATIPAVAIYAKEKDAKRAQEARQFLQQIPKDQRIEQALNRLTFGPRPGDAAQVKAIGLKAWIDRQLHPDRIEENPALIQKLKTLDTLTMSAEKMVREYPSPQILKQMASGQIALPTDPDKRMMIQKRLAKYEKEGDGRGVPQNAAPDPETLRALLTQDQIRGLRQGTPEERVAFFETLPVDKQDDVIESMPRVRQALSIMATPEVRRRVELLVGPQQVVYRDLAEAKMLRAIYSNRQLEEQLDDFWYNHFNVFADKGADRYLVTEYERDAIQPHVLGKFRELLEATAKSPAMLFYLDNWQSVGPNAPQPRGQGNKAKRGLNENYGRELMELHTLGVDGGYTQKDVTEVARCFTGWTINQPQRGGRFVFNPRLHDNGEKVVLGVIIPAGGGESDGEKVLDILAHSPAAAHFISKKLATRFVADDPPAELVNRMADVFLKTDGDIRQVMEAMIDSKEFWSVGAYRSKVKSPFEMVASSVRALNGNVDVAFPLVNQVAQLGEPLYRKLEPTGYSNSSAQWANSAGLMARMNFALQLASNKVPGVKVEASAAKTDDAESGDAKAGNPLAGLPLGSPEFQKR